MSKKIKLIPCLLLVFLAFLLPLKSFAATAPAIAQFKVPGNTSVTSNTPFYVSENTIRNNLIFVRGAKTASSLGVVKIQAKIYIKKDLGGGVTHYSRWNGSYWTAWGHQTSYDLSLFNYNPSSSQSLIGGIQSKDIYYPTSSSSNVTSFLSEFSKDKPVYIRVRVGGQTKTGGSGFWTIIDHYSESTYTAAVKLDNIDPSISFTSPTASTYLNGAAFMQDVSGTVLDNESGIDTSYGVNTECYDKTDSTALILWPSVLTGSTWKNSMGPSFFTDGHQYEIKSTVKDKVGNSGTTSLTFTYDNTAPTNPIKVEAYKKSMLNEPAPIPPPP